MRTTTTVLVRVIALHLTGKMHESYDSLIFTQANSKIVHTELNCLYLTNLLIVYMQCPRKDRRAQNCNGQSFKYLPDSHEKDNDDNINQGTLVYVVHPQISHPAPDVSINDQHESRIRPTAARPCSFLLRPTPMTS
jgi:hypothetical protein